MSRELAAAKAALYLAESRASVCTAAAQQAEDRLSEAVAKAQESLEELRHWLSVCEHGQRRVAELQDTENARSEEAFE